MQHEPEERAAGAEAETAKPDMLRESVPPSTTLYVGNLSLDVRESGVQRKFEKAGEVVAVRIMSKGRFPFPHYPFSVFLLAPQIDLIRYTTVPANKRTSRLCCIEFKDQTTADRALEMFPPPTL